MDSESNMKANSLALLTVNFLELYNQEQEDGFQISIQDAAEKLGVSNRRIRDICHILESIRLVEKRGQGQYWWHGFREVRKALNDLKEEGTRENIAIIPSVTNSEMVVHDEAREESLRLTPSDQESSHSPRNDKEKESSIIVHAQKFLKLFLCSNNDDWITHPKITDVLFQNDQLRMRKTQERCVYDFANVFCALKLIERMNNRRPAYRWLGHIPICEKKCSDVKDTKGETSKLVETDNNNDGLHLPQKLASGDETIAATSVALNTTDTNNVAVNETNEDGDEERLKQRKLAVEELTVKLEARMLKAETTLAEIKEWKLRRIHSKTI